MPPPVAYPVFAVGDVHGRLDWLNLLLAKLEATPEWADSRVVFLGDLVDRGPDVPGTVKRVRELVAAKPGSACVMGNHDLALVGAAGLGGGGPAGYWVRRYGLAYDHEQTFREYLGRAARHYPDAEWVADLARLRDAIPPEDRDFLADLPWAVLAAGHLFVHCGLSPELDEPAEIQAEMLLQKKWHGYATPRFGTVTAREYKPEYPVWIGADKKLSAAPLPLAGKIIVSGHVRVPVPDVNAVRVRLDTSGGLTPPLTAALFRGPGVDPEFFFSE